MLRQGLLFVELQN